MSRRRVYGRRFWERLDVVTATPLPLPAILELPPEISGALTFHLPLEVFALELAGADPAVVEARIAERLADAYRDGLVDPPLYRWAVEHYRATAAGLLDPSPEVRLAAFSEIAPLGDGLVGAAFHGMIRLGYAAIRRDEAELARGLAYLRTRRQVLHGPGTAGTATAAAAAMPSAEDLAGSTVFDQLSLAAASGGGNLLLEPGTPLPGATELLAAAVELIRHDAGSFVTVHSMTGLHGLCEFHRLVIGGPPGDDLDSSPLSSWWRAAALGIRACEIVTGLTPAVGRTECAPEFATYDELRRSAIESGDTHSIKLTVALSRLAEMGLVDEHTVLELGALKLGVDECRA